MHCVVNDAEGLTMRDKTASVSTAKPEQGSLELTEELIRVRAYQFYQERGCEDGHDFDDWLQAEAEIFGTKLAASAAAEDTESGSKAAVA
ncbi:MAG: DUF2934 domain-containing protein [Terriglobales bacterium]